MHRTGFKRSVPQFQVKFDAHTYNIPQVRTYVRDSTMDDKTRNKRSVTVSHICSLKAKGRLVPPSYFLNYVPIDSRL